MSFRLLTKTAKQPPPLRKDPVSRNQFSLQNRTDSWNASEYSEIFRWLGGGRGGGDGPARLRHLTIIVIIIIIIIIITFFLNAAEMNMPKQSAGFADAQHLIEKDLFAYQGNCF